MSKNTAYHAGPARELPLTSKIKSRRLKIVLFVSGLMIVGGQAIDQVLSHKETAHRTVTSSERAAYRWSGFHRTAPRTMLASDRQ